MITTGIINNLYSLGKSFGRLSNSFFVRQFFSTKIILSPKININNSQKKVGIYFRNYQDCCHQKNVFQLLGELSLNSRIFLIIQLNTKNALKV